MEIRVIIFEDNRNLRESLFNLLESSSGFICAGAFAHCERVLENIEETQPDVILMDIELPGLKGIEAVKIIHQSFRDIQILMHTEMEDDDKIFASICAGASGYLLKNTLPGKIIEAIHEVRNGGIAFSPGIAQKVLQFVSRQSTPELKNNFSLSAREMEVLDCLVQGMSYKLIADACFMSIDTVKFHIKHIYRKLHVNSKSEAVILALKNKII